MIIFLLRINTAIMPNAGVQPQNPMRCEVLQ